MGIHRGIGGAVSVGSVVSTVRKWVINDMGNPPDVRASSTDGATGRVDGNTDFSGAFMLYHHTPPCKPGDLFTGTFSEDGTNGGTTAASGAICDAIEVSWDCQTAAPIACTVMFSGTGALTWGAAAADDTSTPTFFTSKARGLSFAPAAASLVYATLNDVTTVRLRISKDNAPYVTAAANGVTKREPGNWDGQLIFDALASTSLSAFPARNAFKAGKAFVTGSLFWDLRWLVVDRLDDITVDIEGKQYVGARVTMSFSSHADIAGTWTKGTIIAPAPTTWWPI